MFDFKLTESGDLDDEEDLYYPNQKISFSVSKADVQRVKFIVTPLVAKARKCGEQNISFEFTERRPSGFAGAKVQDEDEAVQALLLALKTEKNDTYMQDAGTELYKLRHRMVATEQGFKRLQNDVERIVKEILPDAKVVLISKDYPASAYFRYETYIIEIYDGGTKIAELPI